MTNPECKSPYEEPEFLARVAELREQGRTDDEAHLIADGEFHTVVWIPPDIVRH